MKNILRFRQSRLTKRAQTARRRSIKLGVKGFFTRKSIENLYVKQSGRCACGCGVILNGSFEVDHILAISRGGNNFPSNLQLLTPKCNKRKGAKSMEDFIDAK